MNLANTFAGIIAAAMVLEPDKLRDSINEAHDRLPGGARSSETGVRAPRMELCADPSCDEGDFWNDDENRWEHSHVVPSDPTGDAAMRPSKSEADLRTLSASVSRFIAMVSELTYRSLSSTPPDDWDDAVKDGHLLVEMDAVTVLEQTWGAKDVRKWVVAAGDAVHDMEQLASRHQTRQPSRDDRDWTSNLAPADCCDWHLSIHPRYRRPRQPGTNVCADCAGLAYLLGQRPPQWLLEAEVDRASRPKAWTAALSRCMDELGIRRDRAS